jgi:hypothetical protein
MTLVEGEGAAVATMLVSRCHFRRVQHDRLRRSEAFVKPGRPISVH